MACTLQNTKDAISTLLKDNNISDIDKVETYLHRIAGIMATRKKSKTEPTTPGKNLGSDAAWKADTAAYKKRAAKLDKTPVTKKVTSTKKGRSNSPAVQEAQRRWEAGESSETEYSEEMQNAFRKRSTMDDELTQEEWDAKYGVDSTQIQDDLNEILDCKE